MKVRELLSDESKWCQDWYGRDALGEGAAFDGPAACQWCLMGAIFRCYHDSRDVVIAVYGKTGRTITDWNDDPSRTYAEVKALVDELDI